MLIATFLAASVASAQTDPTADAWEATLERAVPAVVAIRVTGTRDFDTEDARSSVGTGFVVDAERGIILTNRHMVHAGPVIADALFIDETEVDLAPIYRDPVHDFGFYRFDPAELRYLEHAALPLAPEAARVGLEVRVVGNDAGDKISILDGTLSRLDRPAPNYGSSTYNDFNTFYFQAASGTSGGSSGSPVLDVSGRAVALNAGGRSQAASSYYLPLDRVVRALQRIQDGQPVTRGTVQTTFAYTSYAELERLGLTVATQDAFRAAFPAATGALTVDRTVPGGPGHDALEPGDILVAINGELVQAFVPLEAVLDESVGEVVRFTVERGAERLAVDIEVQDLHAITPDEYVEMSRAVIHDLSYQQARNYSVPAEGVYIAQTGYIFSRAGIPANTIIEAIDGEEVRDLDQAERLLASRSHGARMTVRFHSLADTERSFVRTAVMDRVWYPMRRCVRDDTTGYWPCTDSSEAPTATPDRRGSALPFATDDKVGARLAPSLVMVDVDIPHPTAGVKDFNFRGAGVVINAQRGWVLVDRDTVPVTLADIEITFAGAVRVPGSLVWLHPMHNVAVIGYDPSLVADVPIRAVTWSDKPLDDGDVVYQVGLDSDQHVVTDKTTVDEVDGLFLGASGTPRFRALNVEVARLTDSERTLGGVVADKKGRVRALWASFLDAADDERLFRGLPAQFLPEWMRSGGEPAPYCFSGLEVSPLNLADAIDRGLSDTAARRIIAASPVDRQLFQVSRVMGASPAAEAGIRGGDVIVDWTGSGHRGPITRIADLHDAGRTLCTAPATISFLRDRATVDISLAGVTLDGTGTDRAVSFAGLVVHDPHVEVAMQYQEPPRGPYIAWLWYGSPAYRHGLRPTRQILAIDGTPTPDLESLLAAVAGAEDRDSVRIRTVNRQGRVQVETLRTDLHYWPTQILQRNADGTWARTDPERVP